MPAKRKKTPPTNGEGIKKRREKNGGEKGVAGFCCQCGNPISADDVFCGQCGIKIEKK